MFYAETPIEILHIELSSKCNASCPMCSRNLSGYGTNPNISVSNLSYADVKQYLPVKFLEKLNRLIVCGNFGDPLMNPQLVEILEYFKSSQPKLKIELHTNGGIGSIELWSQLANLVTFCRFGIDGLESTNHIYRRGVKWPTLMKNVSTFIEAGGNAEWAFLVFKHNELQCAEAETLSRSLGFSKFIAKRTTRNIRSNGEVVERWPAYKNEHEVDYYLELPHDEKFQVNIEKFKQLKSNYSDLYNDYVKKTVINCKVKTEKSVYLDAQGLVWPCCWLSMEYVNRGARQGTLKGLFGKLNRDLSELDFKKQSIENIVSGEIFVEIENSWSSANRIDKCAQICGKDFDPFKSQFS